MLYYKWFKNKLHLVKKYGKSILQDIKNKL